MNKAMTIGSTLLVGILGFGVYGMSSSVASSGMFEHSDSDGDDSDDDEQHFYAQTNKVMSIESELYKEECGSCHMAYPARLLPPASWSNMMLNLEEHFGENAELDEQSRNTILQYLTTLSTPKNGEYRKFLRNMPANEVPERITETVYFRHEHNEIPTRFIAENDKVKSLSQCDSCHKGAENGRFDEHEVYIPGVGRWDD